jgi:hypothetical protein
LDLGQFDAFDQESTDDRECDSAVQLNRGALPQFRNAKHRNLDNVSALQAVFRSRRVHYAAQCGARKQASL